MEANLPALDEALLAKQMKVRERLAQLERVVVAYSGGVDSAYLAFEAQHVLGENALALTARSPSMMQVELQEATELAARIGIRHEIVDTQEIQRPDYIKNDSRRCYACKSELFDATDVVAAAQSAAVVDGFNHDDLSDHRPGHVAAHEHAVIHPLAEAHLTKAEIRALSQAVDLPTWNKPQLACMASRVPYGTEVTSERLQRVELVETELRRLGFFDIRARLVSGTDELVRLELGTGELARAVEPAMRAQIVACARAAGFRFVTLDLEGFRSGRMNEGLVTLSRPRSN